MNNINDAVLQVKGLSKSFIFEDQKIDVLYDIELSILEGMSLSIRGDSGCGKTTLLNLVARLEIGDCGEIFWGQHKMSASASCNSKEASLRSTFLGVVYQSYYLIPELDVLENVLIAGKLSGSYGPGVRDRARALSGGERQRVAIARALINQPKLILADEPTGNLDERTGGEVMDLLLMSCEEENAALILVTHNPSFARATNESIFLKKGKLATE